MPHPFSASNSAGGSIPARVPIQSHAQKPLSAADPAHISDSTCVPTTVCPEKRFKSALLILLCFFILPAPFVSMLHAQGSIGSRALALGQATAALDEDNWAVFHNASLMKTDRHTVSFYAMRFAGFSELTDVAAAGTFSLSSGTLGAGLHHYGFHLYNETRFRSAYKDTLGILRYGASVTYSHISQGGGYGSAGALGLDAGIAAELTGGLILGARAVNINRPAYGDTDEELPRELAIGLTYRMSGSALALADLVKDVRFPLSLRTGFELQLVPGFFVRTGITTKPVTWSAGFGYNPDSRFDVNVAIQRHEVLGTSPGVDFSLEI